MIGITAFNIVVNMAIMGYASFVKLKMGFLKLKQKYRTWRMKKATKEDIS